MRRRALAAAITAALIAFLLAGCAVVPKTSEQAVYAGLVVYTATANQTANLLRTGQISVAQAEEVQDTLACLKPVLRSAYGLVETKGIEPSALRTVIIVQTILARIQHFLVEAKHGNAQSTEGNQDGIAIWHDWCVNGAAVGQLAAPSIRGGSNGN